MQFRPTSPVDRRNCNKKRCKGARPLYNLRRNEDRDWRGSRRLSTEGLAEEAARRDWACRTKTSAPATAQSVDYPDFARCGRRRRRRRTVRSRHPGLRHRRRHGDRRQQGARRPVGTDRRHRHREAVARAQRSQRDHARRARAAGVTRAGDRQEPSCRRRSKAAATHTAWKKFTPSKACPADRRTLFFSSFSSSRLSSRSNAAFQCWR